MAKTKKKPTKPGRKKQTGKGGSAGGPIGPGGSAGGRIGPGKAET